MVFLTVRLQPVMAKRQEQHTRCLICPLSGGPMQWSRLGRTRAPPFPNPFYLVGAQMDSKGVHLLPLCALSY